MANKYLTKLAALSEDAKKEIKQTAVMASIGGAAGVGADAIMRTKGVSGWKVPSAVKAGILVGGLGLLGDVAAVKINRKIEKSASLKERLVKLIGKKSPLTLEQRMTVKGHKRNSEGFKFTQGPTDHRKGNI